MLGTGRGASVGRAAVLSLPIAAGPQPDSPRTPEVEVLIVMSNLGSNWVLAWILDCILTVHIDFFPPHESSGTGCGEGLRISAQEFFILL